MENCNPKLSQYFDSNYAKLQEEISLFIKGFPIIQMNGLGSINELIAQLIRQNGMLAGRFRDQLVQIKEMYRKNDHHEQEIKKKYAELSQQLTAREAEVDGYRERISQMEQQLSSRTDEISRLAQETSRLEQSQAQMIELETAAKQLKQRMFSTFNELLETRLAKNPDIFVEKFQHMAQQLQLVFSAFRNSKRTEQLREATEQEASQFCELILDKFKMDRQKTKNDKQKHKDQLATIDQLVAYVGEFGVRCRETANIFKIVPPDRTVVEKYCEGLEREIDNIDRNVKQIRDRQTEQTPTSGGKRTIDLKLAAEVRQDRGSFEDIIKTLAGTVNKMNSDGSCRNRQHIEDLEKYKADVKQLNERLTRLSAEYEASQQENDETYRQQLATKEQLLKYFEQNLIETKQRLEQEQIRADQLQDDLKEHKRMMERYNQQSQRQENDKQKILDDVERAEQVIIHLEQEKSQLNEKLRSAQQMIDKKVMHLVEQLDEKEAQKKLLIAQHEKEKRDLNQVAETERKTQIELAQNLMALKQAIQRENQTLQSKSGKVAELENANSKLLKEIASMSELVEDLEEKVRSQSLQLRGKELHRMEQEKTIKGLLADNKTNLASLKSIKQEIPQVANIKVALEQTEMKLARLQEQNHSLKGLLKMARQDVNDSRKKLAEFMEVEQQREMLFLKCEAYTNQLTEVHGTLQEREKQLKQIQHRTSKLESLEQSTEKKRLQLLELQADNNRLSIELKHARSLLRKVQQLQGLAL